MKSFADVSVYPAYTVSVFLFFFILTCSFFYNPLIVSSYAAGNEFYVDPLNGDDSGSGELANPWRTLKRSLSKLLPGDTLFLRGGSYFENDVRLNISGTEAQHITIKNYPGERPVIDGGYEEFRTVPNSDWEIVDAGRSIYRSVKTYANAGIIHGYLGKGGENSHLVPYKIYEHLSSDNEDYTETGYVYIGPGVFWNSSDARIYIRLQPSEQELAMGYAIPVDTDPRQNEIYIVPEGTVLLFRSGTSYIDIEGVDFKYRNHALVFEKRSHHITIKNSDILGGRTHILVEAGVHNILFDGITIDDGFPAWVAWTDVKRPEKGGNNTVPPAKNLQQYAIKLDSRVHDVEIKNSVFNNMFDGIAAGDRCSAVRIHHNDLRGIRDDAIDLISSNYHIEVDHNRMIFISKGLSRVGGGIPPAVPGMKFIHHNIIDSSMPMLQGRNDPDHLLENKYRAERGGLMTWHSAFGDHGNVPAGDSWKIYQNTLIFGTNHNGAGLTYDNPSPDPADPQEIYNNIIIQIMDGFLEAGARVVDGSHIFDGNLWHRSASGATSPFFRKWDGEDFMSLAEFKASQLFDDSREYYPPGLENSGIEADPILDSDYRPDPAGPAATGAVALPGHWPGNDSETYRGALPAIK